MKTTKTPDSESIKFAAQLKKNFSEEEIASFILTLLGMSDIAHRFLWETAREFIDLPTRVKYSTIQHARFYAVLGSVIRGEIDEEDTSFEFMPIDEQAWQSDEDFEKRFVYVVKHYYDCLKKEGKI